MRWGGALHRRLGVRCIGQRISLGPTSPPCFSQICLPVTSSWDFETLAAASQRDTFFLLKMAGSSGSHSLLLQGGFYATQLPSGAPALLFAGSPQPQQRADGLQSDGGGGGGGSPLPALLDLPPHSMGIALGVLEAEKYSLEKLLKVIEVSLWPCKEVRKRTLL